MAKNWNSDDSHGKELIEKTYEVNNNSLKPELGRHIASIGKKGIGSVWVIFGVRKVKTKDPTQIKYVLQLWPAPEMIPYTVYELVGDTAKVWVKGEVALPLFWIPRKKKNE